MPIVLAGSVALHGALLAIVSALPAPLEQAVLTDELAFSIVEPEPAPEPEPEPVVEHEPEPVPEPPAAAPPPPERQASPPPPPAPVLTATEAAPAPSDWAHPEGVEGGELGGVPGGEVGGTGDGAGGAVSEATPAPRRGVSRAELRNRLLGYIRGPLSRYIASHTAYPMAARRAHLQGVVVLRLRLDAEGQVLAVRLSRSSGHATLDDAALASVREMRSLPAPPAGLPWDDSQELPLPVTYRLQ